MKYSLVIFLISASVSYCLGRYVGKSDIGTLILVVLLTLAAYCFGMYIGITIGGPHG